jgi:hypothetical protein
VKLDGSAGGASCFTCTLDGLDHLVSYDAATVGIAARRGTYTAMCGHLVYVAALASSAGPLCPRCAQLAQQIQTPVTVPFPRNGGRARARLRRLLGLQPKPD